MSAQHSGSETRFHGAGVSPGIARGRIHVVRDDLEDVSRYRIASSQVGDEIGRFEAALIQTRMQILELQERIAQSVGAKDAAIFDAHLLVIEDRTLIDEVLRKLETDSCNVEWVFHEVAGKYSETLGKIDDPYLRERAVDVQDVARRVIRNLQGKAPKSFLALTEPHILVAHNLTPSDTASMNKERVLGIATDLGSRTSHAAIIARSLAIPAVVGLHDITTKLQTGENVLVDGTKGLTLGQLDTWRMPAFTVRRRVQPFWRWAAAAAIIVGATFALGRFSSPATADVAKLKKEMEESVRQSLQADVRQKNEELKMQLDAALAAIRSQLTNEYQAQMAQVIDSTVNEAMNTSARVTQRQIRDLAQGLNQKLERAREQDREAALAALTRFQNEYQTDFVALRKDLETLASATDDQFQLAREKLIQIASAK